ncbi:MAG: cupin domain-containing protein [Oligoflexia bacterium]|nr:cupin domain-containing protein [Oligoflexia bacterium]
MKERIYRFTCDDIGIYEAVEKYCPRDDMRREFKPDGSWLPKIGKSYEGAISFWKEEGLNKYAVSGLKDWHNSVVKGVTKLIIAELPENFLYEDDFQIIVNPNTVKIIKEYPFHYEGPDKPEPRPIDTRPSFIRHHSSLRDWNAYCAYSGSDESFVTGAAIGADLGLKMIGIHHEILKPGKRSSWPHAHKVEEELVFVISGKVEVWINGEFQSAKAGDAIFFPPNTNLAHSIYNKSNDDIQMIILGEQNAKNDLIYYPEHPKRNEECKAGGYYWDDRPEPAKEVMIIKNYEDIEEKQYGDEANQVLYRTRDLGRTLGAKRVALHIQTLPSGYRSSLPHAESKEEEFVHILKGSPIVWINGSRHQLKEGDSVAFPSGTGIAHTFINESGEDVQFLVSGETTKDDNLCSFPVNPEEKEKCPIWWEDAPVHEIGPDSPLPKK